MQLPDAVFTQLRHLLDMEEGIQWKVGDFIRDVWAEMSRYTDQDDQRKEHASMISQMANGTGADKSTLRSRKKMSVFFTDADRSFWQPPYTYHQMRALMSAGEDKWRDVALWGMDGGWNNGVATIDEIREKITGEIDARELCLKRLIVLERKIMTIRGDLSTPPDVVVALCLIPSILQDTKELLD